MKYLRETGDTIVEVLLAIVIVGSILFSSYQLVLHNSQTMQDSQEHSLALKVAETQAEFLRKYGTFDVSTKQCYSQAGVPAPTGSAICTYQPNGSNSVTYTITISQTAASAPYKVTVRWDQLNGGKGNLDIYYKTGV